MKKIIIKFFSLAILFCFAQQVFAQRSIIRNRREALLHAIAIIDDYEKYSKMDDDESVRDFTRLFANKNVSIYNDLIGLSEKSSLSVDEYSKLFRKNTKIPFVTIKNVKLKSLDYNENGWNVVCTFDKEITYNDNCGINLSSRELYGVDHKLTMVLLYNEESEECKISSITGSIDTQDLVGVDYKVLQAKDPRDEKLYYNGQLVEYNNWKQMFFRSGYDARKLKFKDEDVTASPYVVPDSTHLVRVNYKTKRWRIHPYFDLGMGEPFSFANGTNLNTLTSSTSNFGVDFGYIFPSKGKVKFGMFFGVGLANSNIQMGFTNNNYSYLTKQDVDGDEYKRQYHNLNLSQENKLQEVYIPVYADIDWRFSRYVSFYLNIGTRLNLNLSNKISSFEGTASVDGIYTNPAYGNLFLDYNWGFNGFTQNLVLNDQQLCQSEHTEVKGFVPDLLAGGGFRINLPKVPISLQLGLNYQKSLGDVITIKENEHANQYDGKLVYNTINGLNSTEHAHSMLESAGSVTRGILKFNMGLIFKF